ncbi:PH domain-containing protein [Entamoeba marina]
MIRQQNKFNVIVIGKNTVASFYYFWVMTLGPYNWYKCNSFHSQQFEMSVLKTSALSLQPSEFECWGKKCGGRIKSWKRRFFLLKNGKLWYYANPKAGVAKGFILLSVGTPVIDVSGKKTVKNKHNAIAIDSEGPKGKRQFYVVCENQTDFGNLLTHLKKCTIQQRKLVAPTVFNEKNRNSYAICPDETTNVSTPEELLAISRSAIAVSSHYGRSNALKVKNNISWLKNEQIFTDFFSMWLQSVPTGSSEHKLIDGTKAHYVVSISTKLENLMWISYGSQSVFIQPLVNFLKSVDTPIEELKTMNKYGQCLFPHYVGSWIQMSHMLGTDGGWIFQGEFDVSVIENIADNCVYTDKLAQWLYESRITKCTLIGRDIGDNPPRISRFQFLLDENVKDRYDTLMGSLKKLSLQNLPDSMQKVFYSIKNDLPCLVIDIQICIDGFVRFGFLIPNLNDDDAIKFLKAAKATDKEIEIHKSLMENNTISIQYLECSLLNNGFGCGVYKEGWDVHVHYFLGSEKK